MSFLSKKEEHVLYVFLSKKKNMSFMFFCLKT